MPNAKVDPSQWDTFLETVKEIGAFEAFSKICQEHSVTLAAVFSPRRTTAVVQARWELWILLRKRGLSYTEIGSLFCRNHTTVVEAIRRAEERKGTRARRTPRGETK